LEDKQFVDDQIRKNCGTLLVKIFFDSYAESRLTRSNDLIRDNNCGLIPVSAGAALGEWLGLFVPNKFSEV
jgi:hypothetical protein